jgi:hypothetical protein
MLVFYTFMPIGVILGGLLGAIGLGFAAGGNSAVSPPPSLT